MDFSSTLKQKLHMAAKADNFEEEYIRVSRDFETFLGNPSNGHLNSYGGRIFSYKIPASANKIQLMEEMRKNLVGCEFKQKQAGAIDYGKMRSGEFIFIKNGPHQCNFGCQRDGCSYSLILSTAADIATHTLCLCIRQ
jgi:hypothetical protein